MSPSSSAPTVPPLCTAHSSNPSHEGTAHISPHPSHWHWLAFVDSTFGDVRCQ
ncbi:hypothetical protein K503DRAFT_769999 [Rhizopogon vinicolor AM-OR11-026]|uniref:Uncharacterized protein n=1 Tax=Rhizopogon vinicolor AM-OR11-026 TaxID=1314800 RepID=A0A1B7N222_9AGAM|nr:hypothetical protein K503DRAFT_769999 [Rhizopogon vinicolor AM-OR11-026]